ncbi:Ig-like domain-containing protein [Pseudomonas graminis]|uniref:Ig-like domain-containing protein n=1 Tax=Pseudomonas graminis TaxID=158627 RepID=UPI003C1FC3C4
MPPEIVEFGVDDEDAKAGVPVTIAPYPEMAEWNVIKLSWGGKFVYHQVTAEEVNQPIVITVDEAVILEAGDSDNEGLAVTYEVSDIVDNRSEDWAAEIRITVRTDTSRLSSPIVREATSNVLDLDTLGSSPVTVVVWASNNRKMTKQLYKSLTPQQAAQLRASMGKQALSRFGEVKDGFLLGDKIVVKLTGTTAEGQQVTHEAPEVIIDDLPDMYEIQIPNAVVRQLAQTQAAFSYYLLHQDSTRSESNGAFISVIGEAVRMAAPVALDAAQGAINPNLPITTVQIPWDDSMAAGNQLVLKWIGTRPDLSIYDPLLSPHNITNGEATNKAPINITVPGTHLKAIEGGTLGLYFILVKDVEGTPVNRESARATTLNIGQPLAELLAPAVAGIDAYGVMDPQLPGTKLTVTAYREMAMGDEVHYLWHGIAFDVEDWITITSLTLNKDIVFEISQAAISGNKDGTVEASYWVKRADRRSDSEKLSFTVGAVQQPLLVAPLVAGSEDCILEIEEIPGGAQIVVPHWEGMVSGDSVAINWLDDKGTTPYTSSKNISGNAVGKDVTFTVTLEQVRKSVDGTVTLTYTVTPLEGDDKCSMPLTFAVQEAAALPLPAPTIVEAVGSTLDPNTVRNGAHVTIGVDAQLTAGDEVTLTWTGKSGAGSVSPVKTATAAGEMTFDIDYATVVANDGHSVTLDFTVKRVGGTIDGPSPNAVYDIKTSIGAGRLKIMGARFNRGSYRASATPRRISAFDATTGAVISAQWQYEGDGADWVPGTSFRDTRPDLVLRVSTSDDIVALSPANIIGSGNDTTTTGDAAMVAHRDIHDVIGWGDAAYGGQIPSTIITMDDIVEVSCTRSAYAARRLNGYVVVWGNPEEGGTLPVGEVSPPVQGFAEAPVASVADCVAISSNSMAFAGIKSSGNVVAWGRAEVIPSPPIRSSRLSSRVMESGGVVPPEIAGLTDITQVIGAGNAFAAIRATGQVVAWGSADGGGTVPSEIARLTDIVEVTGNFTAFAAMRGNGRVVAWGTAANGGAVPSTIAALTDITELGSSTARAFSLIRVTGQVMTWGDASYGGTVPEDITTLTDIVEVSATWQAFAARRGNGRVVAWGPATYGGTVPQDIATLSDIVEVVGNAKAFAALRRNGTVVAWGDATVGGDTTAVVTELTNVQAVYANSQSFVALTSDGRVVTWGNALGGGDSSAVQTLLSGKVSYLASAATRGMALKARRLTEKKKSRTRAIADWSKPEIEEADDGFLDPGTDPDRPIIAHVPPGALKYLDRVNLYVDTTLIDYINVNRHGPGSGFDFEIPASAFVLYAEGTVAVWYGVVPANEQQEQRSEELVLSIRGGFEGPASLDLSAHNYVVAETRPPATLPDFVHISRVATWGVAPYTYASSNEGVATADDNGLVTALTNGICDITATDSSGETRRYALTVSGITMVHFLTANTDWKGMQDACAAGGLVPITLTQFKALWMRYAGDVPVTTYLGWLDYPFWTADSVGAGTYSTYNLGGQDVNENASSADASLPNQAVGVSVSAARPAASGSGRK